MKTSNFILYLLMSTLVITSCKRDGDDPDDPHDHNEEELITTVEIHLSKSSGNHVIAAWSDVDGPGGNDPVIDTIFIDTNTTYTAEIEFLNESGDKAHDITHEIEEEGDEHIVCFSESLSGLTITRTDSDGTHDIGLESEWATEASENGSITISLKHQPDVKDGSCTPGETDVEVTFPVLIE